MNTGSFVLVLSKRLKAKLFALGGLLGGLLFGDLLGGLLLCYFLLCYFLYCFFLGCHNNSPPSKPLPSFSLVRSHERSRA